jgi:hypothetical protein
MTLKCLLLFGQIVLQYYGRPFEIPSAVGHVLVELRGRRLEKDLVNTRLLPKLLTESLSCPPCVPIGQRRINYLLACCDGHRLYENLVAFDPGTRSFFALQQRECVPHPFFHDSKVRKSMRVRSGLTWNSFDNFNPAVDQGEILLRII